MVELPRMLNNTMRRINFSNLEEKVGITNYIADEKNCTPVGFIYTVSSKYKSLVFGKPSVAQPPVQF